MKYIRYTKFATAILFFELMFGRICYEYGYAHSDSVIGIWSMYLLAAFALAYVIVCICQGWGETSLGTSIFTTVLLGVPFIAICIAMFFLEIQESGIVFAAITLTVFGIAFVLELVILALNIKQHLILKRNYTYQK